MLNNPLLLTSSIGGGDNPNVFWVTPEPGEDNFGEPIEGYAGFLKDHYGSIEPNTFEYGGRSFEVNSVINSRSIAEATKGQPISNIQFIGDLRGVVIYLGRHDLRKSFVLTFSSFNDQTNTSWFDYSEPLFDEKEDIGKPIPVWISTEPPPY